VLKNDLENLDRKYFPEIENGVFNEKIKKLIIEDIENDCKLAFSGIKRLPKNSKLAVLTAYNYYIELLNKIKKVPAEIIISKRLRISNFRKLILVFKSLLMYKLKLV